MRAQDPIRSRDDALALVWLWAEQLDQYTWPKVSGGSERAVAEALGRWALTRGGIEFTASVEEIAIEAGLTRNSARRSLRQLEDDGLIRKVGAPGPRTASRWKLIVDGPPGALETPMALGGLEVDWARWRAVGKTSTMVWRRCVSGASSKELAAEFGISQQAVRKHLTKLAKFGLVHREGLTWTAQLPANISERFATHGARQRQTAELERRREEREPR
jgi:DNA-binding MarR family transcriptional regulator